ncbi:hypothetical protein BJ912DRAFT_974838, partial [Pholiota molesta]
EFWCFLSSAVWPCCVEVACAGASAWRECRIQCRSATERGALNTPLSRCCPQQDEGGGKPHPKRARHPCIEKESSAD